MRKGYDFIGKTIVSYGTGEKIDRVKDIVFDPNTNRLLALVVREGNWFRRSQVVLFQDLRAIGTDAVIINSEDAIIEGDRIPEVQQVLVQPNILRGTQILTTDGRNLGRIVDLYVDEETGIIEGYEVSGGSFADGYAGPSFIPAPKTLKIGHQVAFVPPDILDSMAEQNANFGSQTSSVIDVVGTNITDTSVSDVVVEPATRKGVVIGKTAQWMVNAPDGTVLVMAGQEVSPEIADLAEQHGALHELYRATGADSADVVAEQTTALHTAPLATPATRYTVEQTLGRRSHRMIRSVEGSIVVAPGQIVTERVIERARRYHQEQQLLAAVGLPTVEDMRTNEQFETTVSQVGERLRYGAQRAGVEARGLWEQLKVTAEDWKVRSRQASEERRVKAALGRPVTRVILDRQDHIILNVGELVTHEAIEAARRANVLDILLDSIHTQDAQLSSNSTRAPRTGTASLEAHEMESRDIRDSTTLS